jgi:hypothetical protein
MGSPNYTEMRWGVDAMALWRPRLASLTRQIRIVNQWLTALQSLAIIAGVIVAIWQLSEISEQNKIFAEQTKLQTLTLKQTQLAASATLVLQLRDKLDHCRPVKQAVSADKGMILNAVLAI